MDNNNNDNNIIKIISWNVNAFCKTKNWNNLSTEELKNEQYENCLQILAKIKRLLDIIGKNGILFLQEIPKILVQNLDNLSELLSDYKIEKNFDEKYPNTSTIAIYKKGSNWENKPFNTSKAVYNEKESVYYYNRCILL